MKKYFKVYLFFIILHQMHKSPCGEEFSRKKENDLTKGCEISEYKCSKDSACINKTYFCDGKADCQIDAEDERNCPHNCSPGYFECAADECINASHLLCDGKVDCESNSKDEWGCIKLKEAKRKKHSNVICAKTTAGCNCTIMSVLSADGNVRNTYGLTCNNNQGAKLVSFPIILNDNVTYFDFSQNQLGLLGSLSNSTFFSHKCSTHIYLTNNSITKLAGRMFEALKNLYHLELNENEIETLENDTFSGLENLNELNLGGNLISKITSRAFTGLKSLEKLILERNQINHIANDSFFPFVRLKYLNLNFNDISKLESKTLANLTFLEELYLQSNMIEHIEDNSFAGLEMLKILHLDENKMIKLTSKLFNGLNSLEELLMNNNEILYIENYTFSGLHNLKTLILYENRIPQLTTEMYRNSKALKTSVLFHDEMKLVNCSIFTELKNLKSLDLGSNKISKLPSVVFKNLVQLNELILHTNEIAIIESETFTELRNLTSLYLRYNKISVIASGTFKNNTYLKILDLEGNQIDVIEDGFFEGLEHLEVLYLENNRITKLEWKLLKNMNHLQYLFLHNNQIQVIGRDAFDGMDKLGELYLHENKISKLPSSIFKNLKDLYVLSLQNNEIKSFENDTFSGLNNLLYLNLSNNSIIWKDENVFESLKNLTSLETDEYRFCCLLKNLTHCSPQTNEFSSCDRLIEKTSLRICIWILGITAVLANLFVIIFRTGYKSYNINKVNSFLIKNLAISDTFMGFYLLIIAVADLSYGNGFSSNDFNWRSNRLCHIAGSISTFSSLLTVLTLTTMTLDRFFCISFPFRTRLREIRQFRIVMALFWIVAIIIAHSPIFLSHEDSYLKNLCSRSAFCLPLHVSNNKIKEWHYSILLFIVLHTIALVIIVFSYIGIYWSTHNTRLAVRAVNQLSAVPHMVMIFRMTLLVLGAALSKIPIIILGVRSIYGYTISPNIYAWIIGVVLPLNAALNPILYTISSLPITFTLFEYLEKRSFRSPIIFRSPLYLKKSTDEKLNSLRKSAALSDNTENTNYKSTGVE